MIFKNKKHEEMYKDICKRMWYVDCYHAPVAYLIAMDNVLREHVNEVFDFDKDIILVDVLREVWQTSSSRSTTRLAFNLWNGYCPDDDVKVNDFCVDSPRDYTPCRIFGNYEYAPYYWQAIKLCFEYEEVKK